MAHVMMAAQALRARVAILLVYLLLVACGLLNRDLCLPPPFWEVTPQPAAPYIYSVGQRGSLGYQVSTGRPVTEDLRVRFDKSGQ